MLIVLQIHLFICGIDIIKLNFRLQKTKDASTFDK